jgi:TM2 domain-containing membrane protein YozV
MISLLERRQKKRDYNFIKMSSFGINYLDKGYPWLAALWSALLPGFGHLYNGKIIKGIILLFWTVAIIYFSNVNDAIISTFTGHFIQAGETVNYQWLLFFPSIYLFAIWDSFSDAVETNKLLAEEQKNHLRQIYDNPGSWWKE